MLLGNNSINTIHFSKILSLVFQIDQRLNGSAFNANGLYVTANATNWLQITNNKCYVDAEFETRCQS